MSGPWLTGWGRSTRSRAASVAKPRSLDELRELLAASGGRGATARGLGRSYGDASHNAGGTVLDMTGWTHTFTLRRDELTISSGFSLDEILRRTLPTGRWLPVVPGTRHVTVGGAIAADVHGKNHHHDGSFGNHVRSITLLIPSGDVVTVRADSGGEEAELFWATIGGMGLTGIILEATLELTTVETSYFLVDTDRTHDVHELLDIMAAGDQHHPYSVAWFDTTTHGPELGRGVLTHGRSAPLSALSTRQRRAPLELVTPTFGRVPVVSPLSWVNPLTTRVFNQWWYHKAPRSRRGEVQDVTTFFHPLDVVGDWNRIYGPRGFIQYQCVVPDRCTLTALVELMSYSDHVAALTVLKRFGTANRAMLSFPQPGWTLAADFPVRPGLHELLAALDAIVRSSDGRLYLAKDGRTDAATLAAGYPRLGEFRAIRQRVDPHGMMTSDLARRLEL